MEGYIARQLRCVIDDDPPALVELAKRERELSVRVVLFSLQRPVAEHYSRILAQHGDLEPRESQDAHFLAAVITLLIPVGGPLPPLCDLGSRDKGQFVRLPIARHKAVDIAF